MEFLKSIHPAYYVIGFILLLIALRMWKKRWHRFEYAGDLPKPDDFPPANGEKPNTFILYEIKFGARKGREAVIQEAVIIDNPIETREEGGEWEPGFQRRWLCINPRCTLHSKDVRAYRKKESNYTVRY